MKKMKTLLSVLLALTLTLVFAVSAFADGNLTVKDDGTSTYDAYKIFDATDDGSGNVTYTLAATSEWKAVLIDADGNSLVPGLTFTHVDADPSATPAVKEHYKVTKSNTFRAADFADYLKGKIDDSTITPTPTVPGFNAGASQSVPAGYYLVISTTTTTSTVEAKAMLTTVLEGQSVNIQNKNDMPFDKTVDNKKEEGVQIGDTVNFEIKSKVPDVGTATSYIYLISDKMDAGLTFNSSSFEVIIGTETINLNIITDESALLTGNQVRFEKNEKTFELSLNMIGRTAGQEIKITYTAVVNEKAAGKVTENNAVLEYGNDPSNLTVKDTQTKVYTSKLIIDKFENGAPEQKLSGAKFVLKNSAGEYYYVDTNGNVSWISTPKDTADADITVNKPEDLQNAANITIVVTDSDGAASFAGLADGTYQLVEIKAPAGYTLLANPIQIPIDGSRATAVGLTAAQVTQLLTNVANVANTLGTNLPSTGGIGTTIFYLVGGVLVLGAAVVLIVRKRMSVQA